MPPPRRRRRRGRRRLARATIAAPPSTTTIIEISAQIGKPPVWPCQNSVPAIAPVWPPTAIGIVQAKIFVVFDLSLTWLGIAVVKRWMRWSCHSKRPVLSIVTHRGAALGVALGGTGVVASRSWLR